MNTQSDMFQAAPEGYYTVTPWVIVKGAAQLINFLKEAFSAELLFPPAISEDGTIGHAEVRIGDSVVMMFDAKKEWAPTPSFLRLYVRDCNAVYQQALQAGAVSVTRPTRVYWGDDVARVRDPFGNLWWIQARMEELDEEEMVRRAGEKQYVDAMEYVQNSPDGELRRQP